MSVNTSICLWEQYSQVADPTIDTHVKFHHNMLSHFRSTSGENINKYWILNIYCAAIWQCVCITVLNCVRYVMFIRWFALYYMHCPAWQILCNPAFVLQYNKYKKTINHDRETRNNESSICQQRQPITSTAGDDNDTAGLMTATDSCSLWQESRQQAGRRLGWLCSSLVWPVGQRIQLCLDGLQVHKPLNIVGTASLVIGACTRQRTAVQLPGWVSAAMKGQDTQIPWQFPVLSALLLHP